MGNSVQCFNIWYKWSSAKLLQIVFRLRGVGLCSTVQRWFSWTGLFWGGGQKGVPRFGKVTETCDLSDSIFDTHTFLDMPSHSELERWRITTPPLRNTCNRRGTGPQCRRFLSCRLHCNRTSITDRLKLVYLEMKSQTIKERLCRLLFHRGWLEWRSSNFLNTRILEGQANNATPANFLFMTIPPADIISTTAGINYVDSWRLASDRMLHRERYIYTASILGDYFGYSGLSNSNITSSINAFLFLCSTVQWPSTFLLLLCNNWATQKKL